MVQPPAHTESGLTLRPISLGSLDEVVETVYNAPSQVNRKAALFAMSISPPELRVITSALSADQASLQAASAIPQPDATDSPNALTPR